MMISDRPEATASSTTYWIIGLSTRGSISLGCALVAGRNRVPSPAAGKTALRTFMDSSYVVHPRRFSAPEQHQGRDVREPARQSPDRRGADQKRQRKTTQEIEHVARGEGRGGSHELGELRDVGAMKVGHDEGADTQGEAIHHRREPRQVEPGPRHGDGLVQSKDRRDRERQDRLQTVERRAAEEYADGEGERHPPRWVVEPQ